MAIVVIATIVMTTVPVVVMAAAAATAAIQNNSVNTDCSETPSTDLQQAGVATQRVT